MTAPRDHIAAARAALAEGEAIIKRANDDYHLSGKSHDDIDGPRMQDWKQDHPEITAPAWKLDDEMANIIRTIINSNHAGRGVIASAALTALRERYGVLDPNDLPDAHPSPTG